MFFEKLFFVPLSLFELVICSLKKSVLETFPKLSIIVESCIKSFVQHIRDNILKETSDVVTACMTLDKYYKTFFKTKL